MHRGYPRAVSTEVPPAVRADADVDPPPEGDRAARARLAVLGAGGAILAAYYGILIRGIGPGGLVGDLDLQYSLAHEVLGGALPVRDFEHGWNTAWWAISAVLAAVSGDNVTMFAWLSGRVGGFMVAAAAVLVIAWRLRLPPLWCAALIPTWALISHVPTAKYATPLVWALALLPVGRGARDGTAMALRIGGPATLWWFHIDLAVLLGAGVAMYDLFGARDRPLTARLRRVAGVGLGLALGLGTQVAAYAAWGLPPADLLARIVGDWTSTYDANFGYPLGAPETFRQLIFPATLVAAFVPVVWRRLSEPTRFLALTHLGMALIGLRRVDDNHIAAAATILGLLAVLVVHDLVAADPWDRPRGPRVLQVLFAAGGALWAAAAIAVGFRTESLIAIIGLCTICLAAVVAAQRAEAVAASVGALVALAGLVGVSLLGGVASQARQDEARAGAQAVADALADEVDRCIGPGREAWVVPGPLTLYRDLELVNPTPHVVFWYSFEGRSDDVIDRLTSGDLDAVIQVGAWPESVEPIRGIIESELAPCASTDVPLTGQTATIWSRRG